MNRNMVRVCRNLETGQGGGGTPPDPQPQQQPEPSEGYPANTRVADMTPEQQAAYWKAQSRKHEDQARARADYDNIVKERDELRKNQETEAEKRIREEREAAVSQERQAANNRIVKALIEGALKARNAKDEDVQEAVRHANLSAFLDDKGEVLHDAIISYAMRYASSGTNLDFGQGKRGDGTTPRPGQQGLERAKLRYPEKVK